MTATATPADVLSCTRRNAVIVGDCLDGLRSLPDGCVQTCVTSPPYFGLRDYGMPAQIGQEPTPRAFVDALVAVFAEVHRALRDDGTLWLNLGDSYNSGGSGGLGGSTISGGQGNQARSNRSGHRRVLADLKPKDLMGIPWRVAFALQDAGWWLRSDCIWSKPNPMPESVTDRPTRAHEYVFLLTKRERYFYDAGAIREAATQPLGAPLQVAQHKQAALGAHKGGTLGSNQGARERNARTVWSITPEPFDGAHFATMPPELARRCILAGSRRGDVVLDPFAGAGTTALVAVGNGRRAIGCELNPKYARIALDRVAAVDTDATEPVRVEAPAWGDLFAGRVA